MAFSKKAKASDNNLPNVAWEAYNAHLEEAVKTATEDGESKNQVCFISCIVDTGTQPSQEPYTVYDEAPEGDPNFDKQRKLLEADFGCYVEGGKFHIPNKPVDSVVFFVDFPDIKVNYGKFFSPDGEDSYKPHRTLLAGEWDKIATYTGVPSGGYGGKSRISVLAKATGVTKGNPPADFDIADLLGVPFTMDVTYSRGGDKNQYLGIDVANPSSKHKAIPVPEHDVVPFGISMDGGNSPEELEQIARKGALLRRLELAEGWEGSKLKAELDALKGVPTTTESRPEDNVDQQQGNDTPEESAPIEGQAEDGIDLDDGMPF